MSFINPKSVIFDESFHINDEMLEWFKKEQERLEKQEHMRQMAEKLQQHHTISTPLKGKKRMQRMFSGASVKDLQNKVTQLQQAIELIQQAKFKRGEVAYHPSYGNCLIQDVVLVDQSVNSSGAYDPNHVPNLIVVYDIITVGDISRTGGPVEVSESELVIYNDMTKALFDKKGH